MVVICNTKDTEQVLLGGKSWRVGWCTCIFVRLCTLFFLLVEISNCHHHRCSPSFPRFQLVDVE